MTMELLFSEIIKRHYSLIRSIIRRYFPNKIDSDDVYQEICVHIFKKIQVTPSDQIHNWSEASWLTTITKNKCLDILRSSQYKNKIIIEIQSDYQLENSKKEIFHQEDSENLVLKTSVKELLKDLKHDERKIIILRFINGYSMNEIANILNLSNPSVYLRRALNKIKEHLLSKDFFTLFDGLSFTDLEEYDKEKFSS
jgi:RNA polymerase sigma-70 factor, ECF subfamily